jgi:putative membrane-bound dehydrogenase-like protein
MSMLVALLLVLQDYKDELPRLKPTEPADALATFRTAPGVRLELVAAEPLVVDPIDLAFDELGRLWVVEMIDYPFGAEEGNPPQGRVRRLEDADGDGRFDRAEVIADRIAWPTGLALWKGGAYVVAPPVLLYVKEGVREVVQGGFGFQNVQGLANNLKWGLDGRIHGSGGTNGGTLAPSGLALHGRSFRFLPGGDLEPESGGGQFGFSFDDFGRRFVCSNSVQARHVVMDDAALRRNPRFAVPQTTASIAADGDAGPVFRASPYEPWRVVRTRLRKSGIEKGIVEPMGSFTSATGIFAHEGRLYIGDVSGNLVHRKALKPNGSTFVAERIDAGSEFIASTDNWFRPANFATGPDGALYIADMYRECIEHPKSLPESIKKHLDLTSGKDRGRIWRVVEGERKPWVRPAMKTAADLAAALARPEAWWRQTAARLAFERQDKALVPLVEPLLRHERPEVRVAAMSVLEGLGAPKAESLLLDPHAGVREVAVRFAPLAALWDHRDADPRVRLELAFRLGEGEHASKKEALDRLRPGADRWLQWAISLAAGERTAEAKIREAVVVPLVGGGSPDRKKVVEEYRSTLTLAGDARRGLELYRKFCAPCHRSGTEGAEVGPDLATVRQKTPEELLVSILDPSREVNPQYVSIRVMTSGGDVLDGLAGAENATSLTLKRAGGETVTLLRIRIEKMVRSTTSLMPEGFEKALDAAAMADLIRFLREGVLTK